MSNLTDLVPPLELCKLIPVGEFGDSALVWHDGYNPLTKHQYTGVSERPPMTPRYYAEYPAPTFDEILDELHKCQEDVFVKWSETAYHGWLVNAYSHGRNEDYQAHDESKVTAALKVWLKLKGIEA